MYRASRDLKFTRQVYPKGTLLLTASDEEYNTLVDKDTLRIYRAFKVDSHLFLLASGDWELTTN